MFIAVCDSSRISQVLFINALREWDPKQYAECFTSGKELLKTMRERPVFEIVFLDIYFPDENGLDIAAEIQSLSPRTGIVFLTRNRSLALDAWSMNNVLHYLVKPITVEGIRESFQRLKNTFPEPHPMIVLNNRKESQAVYLEEIVCICSSRHEKEVHLTDSHIIRIWTEFKYLEEKLDARFLKLNRRTLVNMEHIWRMNKEDCLLDDGTRFDFPRRERKAVREAYEAWLYTHISRGKQE